MDVLFCLVDCYKRHSFLNLGIIEAGQEATGSVVIPAPIPAGDLNFKIRIIPNQAETNLENNVVNGRCIG